MNAAAASGDTEALIIPYVRLRAGDDDDAAARGEIDKAWVQALLPLLDLPEVDHKVILPRRSARLRHPAESLLRRTVQRPRHRGRNCLASTEVAAPDEGARGRLATVRAVHHACQAARIGMHVLW